MAYSDPHQDAIDRLRGLLVAEKRLWQQRGHGDTHAGVLQLLEMVERAVAQVLGRPRSLASRRLDRFPKLDPDLERVIRLWHQIGRDQGRTDIELVSEIMIEYELPKGIVLRTLGFPDA
jgi:hypothetical protein